MKLIDQIKERLAADGVVQVTTYLKSTIYTKKHADWFFMDGDDLRVRHGKKSVVLAHGEMVLVGIRFGWRK